jgi:mannose-6-phosphate isomerase class I
LPPANLLAASFNYREETVIHKSNWRKTTQDLMPAHHVPTEPGQYDLYPGFPIDAGKIHLGFASLAARIAQERRVVIDGYGGVFWEDLHARLSASLRARDLEVSWVNVNEALKPEAQINAMIDPFLGGDDPIFGTRFTGTLLDFFDSEKLIELQPDPGADISILYGCGAALAGWSGLIIYVDLPKNEIQFRSRAEMVTNLGARYPIPPKQQYKRFYFVDWPALNAHKAHLLSYVDLMVDGQRPDEPAWMTGRDLRIGLDAMAHNVFRVRPWFEPGVWGGHWIQRHIPQLPQDVPNYAWSFELIVPENGLIFESDGTMLEVSFDCLMFQSHRAVLGDSADAFGYEFPIRFDFLDTVEGGNLSVQCHPRPEFIRQHFGETFTQDETYYILDCEPGSRVYLGFQEDIDPVEFRAELERSFTESAPIDVDRFVHSEPAHKHDLFLIPNGTIHCSGTGVLVLEISATPYIFTFKMYDWMRLDLDGKPRPINLERAFANLYFDRKGERIRREFVSHPQVTAEEEGWQIVHLPTHPVHFYDVQRFEFDREFHAETAGTPHILSLVEGRSLVLETANGLHQRFNYAETFVIPAAAGSYRLINESGDRAKVICAFLKPGSKPA